MNFSFIKLYEGTKSLPEIVLGTIQLVLIIAGILAFAYFIYGGILFITSQGDSEKVTSARNTLLYAIIGIIVIVFSYAIVSWVGGAFNGGTFTG